MFSIGSYLSQIKSGSTDKPEEKITGVVLAQTPEKPSSSSKDYTQLIRNNETKDRVIQSTIAETKPLRSRTAAIN